MLVWDLSFEIKVFIFNVQGLLSTGADKPAAGRHWTSTTANLVANKKTFSDCQICPSYARLFPCMGGTFTLPKVNCLLELAPIYPPGPYSFMQFHSDVNAMTPSSPFQGRDLVEVLLRCLDSANTVISTWVVLTGDSEFRVLLIM